VTFKSACVVGAGRVGKALAARLGGRIPTWTAGREVEVGDAELVVICVPDRAIPEVAQAIETGPWVTHTSGACRLDALAPHERRFSFHPLQTFVLDLGPEQLDGSWAAVSGEDEEAGGGGGGGGGGSSQLCSASRRSSSTTTSGLSTTPPLTSRRPSSSRCTTWRRT
jgi:hypothetical protein